MIRLRLFTLLFALFVVPVPGQTLQGTAFTYQGLLSQGGTPLNGNVDMTFALFDAPSGGNQIGPTLPFTAANGNPMVATNGVFDATLDFGSTAFNGVVSDQRFLEVTVSGNALTPRTPIQNAPYALQSQTAELAYGVTNASIGSAQIINSQVQQRVTGVCASGSISAIAANGTVTCQSGDTGTITGVTAGSGLSGGGTSGNVTLSADTSIVQSRVSGTCPSGSSISAVAANGTVTCQAAGSGTISGVTPGTGLTGGGSSGNVTLAVATPLALSGSTVYPDAIISANDTATSGDAIAVLGSIATINNGVAVGGESMATTGIASGVEGDARSPDGSGVYGTNSATSGAAEGVTAVTASPGGHAVGGYASANSGGNVGVFGETDSGFGFGLYGRAADTTGAGLGAGTGVRGESGTGTGVVGVSNADVSVSSVAGVVGIDTNASAGFGVYGQTNGTGGAGVYGLGTYAGVWGHGINTAGIFGNSSTALMGVWGENDNTSGYGMRGESPNIGVYGGGQVLLGVTTLATYGVFGTGVTGVHGESTSTSGYGVVGYDSASSGIARGVYGQSNAPGSHAVEGYSGPGVGVYGATVSGWAGYFAGNVSVQGTLSKTAGSFQIDDPLDPANKYLYHSFVESPDMKNIYDGIATLDALGAAWVNLPDYFEALNQDFRYQLTAIGQPAASLYVAEEVSGNRFRIAGGFAGQRISWQVTGTRKDAYAQAHRIPVEVDKPASERGKYLYPALFGQPESKSVYPVSAQLAASPTAPALPAMPIPAHAAAVAQKPSLQPSVLQSPPGHP